MSLEEAQAAHDAGAWATAAAAYERYFVETGDCGVLLAMGDVLVNAGRFDRARESYTKLANTSAAEEAIAYARLGKLELTLDRPAAARVALRRAYAAGYSPSVDDLEPSTIEAEPLEAVSRLRLNGGVAVAVGILVKIMETDTPLEGGAVWQVDIHLIRSSTVQASLVDRLPSPDLRLQCLGLHADRRLAEAVFRMAGEAGADVVIAESAEAAETVLSLSWSDPMAGFISLAENGAVIQALRVHRRVVAEFGSPDAIYDGLQAALADLLARAARAGFTDLARSWSAPPMLRLEEPDSVILRARYPERARAVGRVLGRASARARDLATALDVRPLKVLLDLFYLRPHHDGIAEVTRALTLALESLQTFELHVLCSLEAANFHGLDRFAETGRLVERPPTRGYAACLRLAQPFDMIDVERTWSAAPVAGFIMHDPIGLDCEHLDTGGFESIWRRTFARSELIGFVSRFSADQFKRRFLIPDRPGHFVALNSTCVDDYAGRGPARPRGSGVLVVGNAFPHKNLVNTVARLRVSRPELDVTVLGVGRPLEPGLRWFRSGDLSPEQVDELYAAAGAVIYPSYYEGFGLPVMHALAQGRPVLALDQPAYREIKEASRMAEAVHLFDTTNALVDAVTGVLAAPVPLPRADVKEHTWSEAAQAVASAVQRAIEAFDKTALRERIADSLERVAPLPPPLDRKVAATEPFWQSHYVLEPGCILRRGEQLTSKTGTHALNFQADGNLVLYAAAHGAPHLALWATGPRAGAEELALHDDGRLVLRDGAGTTLWSVQAPAGARLELLPGRLVLVDDVGVHWEVPDAVQSSELQPAFARAPGILYGGDQLLAGEGMTSRLGRLRLALRPDGPAVSGSVGETWSVRLDGADRLAMQEDGNLVAYTADGHALWSTGTSSHVSAWARLDDEDGLIIEDAAGILWRAGFL